MLFFFYSERSRDLSAVNRTDRCNGPRVVPCRKYAEVCILRMAHARANVVDAMQPA